MALVEGGPTLFLTPHHSLTLFPTPLTHLTHLTVLTHLADKAGSIGSIAPADDLFHSLSLTLATCGTERRRRDRRDAAPNRLLADT